MEYYALTSLGLEKVEAGLEDGPMDSIVGALMDLEEQDSYRPHTLKQIASIRPDLDENTVYTALMNAIIRGYVEKIKPGDERFPNFS